MINIEFTKYHHRLLLKKLGGKRFVFDMIRRKDLMLLPEEMVRQLVVQYLISEKGYSKNRIALEKSLKVNTLEKRCDILIYDAEMKPFLLVECKAPEVKISQATFRQIAWYNMPLKVPYLMVTNGITTYCCEMDYELETFRFLQEVPAYAVLPSK